MTNRSVCPALPQTSRPMDALVAGIAAASELAGCLTAVVRAWSLSDKPSFLFSFGTIYVRTYICQPLFFLIQKNKKKNITPNFLRENRGLTM